MEISVDYNWLLHLSFLRKIIFEDWIWCQLLDFSYFIIYADEYLYV